MLSRGCVFCWRLIDADADVDWDGIVMECRPQAFHVYCFLTSRRIDIDADVDVDRDGMGM